MSTVALALVVVLGLLVLALVAKLSLPGLLRRWIRKRLGGYRRQANVVDPALPERLSSPKKVAVLGGGVAGLTAAVTLARRGFGVTLFESKAHLGGKLGSWPVELAPGRQVWVSHGFHAFFPHYWNLDRFLRSLEVREGFRSIGDYVIVNRGGDTVRFADLERTPALNLLSLARAGVFDLRDAFAAPGRDLYGLFLEYDQDRTFAELDHLSFARFNQVGKVPPRLRLAFDTFARAFFADEDKISLAELVKSFHFYYLSQDQGLIYDYPDRDYEAAFLAPVRRELERLGAQMRLSSPVHSLSREVGPTEAGGTAGGAGTAGSYRVNGEVFDAVVLATDVVGARAIVTGAQGLPKALVEQFEALQPGQRYAVLRVWLDKDIREDIPVFVITDRVRVLDAVAVYHRLEKEAAVDARAHGDFILELHCYAVPDALEPSEVKAALMEELGQFFPELQGAQVRHEVYQLNRDFTAFHVGMYAGRPTVETGVRGLVCAGDWVKLPFPAMLLECACASGLWAANQLLSAEGLRQEPVVSVPLRGLMAGMPSPPGRKVLFEGAEPRREAQH